MGRLTARRPAQHLAAEAVVTRPETLAVEERLEVRVKGAPLTVTMCTPGSDVELAQSFYLLKGLIAHRDDVITVRYCRGAHVDRANTHAVTRRGRADYPHQPLRQNVQNVGAVIELPVEDIRSLVAARDIVDRLRYGHLRDGLVGILQETALTREDKGNEMLYDTLRSDLENLRAEIDVGWQSLASENTRFDIGGCLLTAMYRIASRNPEDCARRHALTRALGLTHRDGSAAYCATFRWNDAQREPGMIKRWIKEALR